MPNLEKSQKMTIVSFIIFAAIVTFGLALRASAAPTAPISMVPVGFPAINCVFDTDCTITVNDFTDTVTLSGATGSGFLQSRQFPIGEPGTQGAALYPYLYRLDLRNIAPAGNENGCIFDLTLDFGPIVPLDYDGDGTAEEAFIATSGGVGDFGPDFADQNGDLVTFTWHNGLCPGNTSFFFGLASTQPPETRSATLDGATFDPSTPFALTLDSRVPSRAGLPGNSHSLYIPLFSNGSLPSVPLQATPTLLPKPTETASPTATVLPPATMTPSPTVTLVPTEEPTLEPIETIAPPTPTVTPSPTATLNINIDPNIEPLDIELPTFDEQPRPLGGVSDDEGTIATFVTNELVVMTDDSDQLERILAAYNGEILTEILPAEADMDLPEIFLVRVETDPEDLNRLVPALGQLDDGEDLRALGEYSFSDAEAASLMGIAAHEAADGVLIGVNWINQNEAVPLNSFEAGSGPSGYSSNAYNWNFYNSGSTQDIGVADAWDALHYAGKYSNRLRYAILDQGFAPNSDFPASTIHLNALFPWPPEDIPGYDSPWHGTHVMQTAMAVPGNNFGIVGVAHTVAEPVNIYSGYDFVTSIASVVMARSSGARVINMSYSAEVPQSLDSPYGRSN